MLLAAFGTRGDLQPSLALAVGLRSAGHSVVFCAPPNFVAWIASFGFDATPVGVDFEVFTRETALAPVRGLLGLRKEIARHYAGMAGIVDGVDAVVGVTSAAAASSYAEQLGLPYAFGFFCPGALPSAAHSSLLLRSTPLPRWANTLSWSASVVLFNALFRGGVNRERRKIGMPPIADGVQQLFSGRVMLAADPVLAPAPPDSPPNLVQTGAWLLEDPAPIDPGLETFLAAGPPPVFFGFGSVADASPERTTNLILEAASLAGVRALIAANWAGLGRTTLPPTAHVAGQAPHLKLFPRVAAVVHHGGAGVTTAAALSGTPQIVVPHGFDQFYWAHRVEELGIGTRVRSRTALTPDGLAESVRRVVDQPGFHRRAGELAPRMTRDGVEQAVRALEAHVLEHARATVAGDAVSPSALPVT